MLVSACDNGVYYDMEKYKKLVEEPDVDIIIWSFSNNPTSKLFPHMYAWLDVDENNYIKRVSIKKPFDDVENKHAIIGTMYFKKAKYFKEGLNKEKVVNKAKTTGEPPLMLAMSVFYAIKDAVASIGNYQITPELNAPATPERILMSINRIKNQNGR